MFPFLAAANNASRRFDPLTMGAGYADIAFRHDCNNIASTNFTTVANGADTEVSQWRDVSSNAVHATAAIATAGGTDNMLLVPNAINGRQALRARSMSMPGTSVTAPVLKGMLSNASGFPTTTGWTKNLVFALGKVAGASTNANSLFSSALSTQGHFMRQVNHPSAIRLQADRLITADNPYLVANNWGVLCETSDPVSLFNEIHFNGNFFQRSAIASYVNDASFAYGALNTTKIFPADAFFGTMQANRGILSRQDIVNFACNEFARWGWVGAKRPINFDFIGDSVTQGLTLANIPLQTFVYKAIQSLVAKLDVDGSRAYPSISATNYGVSGSRTSQMLASHIATTGSGVFASGGAFTKFANRACRQVCSIMGGTNNIVLSLESPETAYENLRLLVAGAKASNKYDDIVVWTQLPRYDNVTLRLWTPEMFAYNALIRAGMQSGGSLRLAGATHLCDTQTLLPYGNPNAPITTGVVGDGVYGTAGDSGFNTSWFATNPNVATQGFVTDGTHPSEAGHQLLAQLFISTLGL